MDPYQILKVSRQADARAIKQAYRRMSRLYHPDAARHRDILPGSCDNQDQVRDQWERINWSYDLLSDPSQRRKYDRHEALADPGRALRRAAAQAAWKGVTSVGKGLWNMGSMAVSKIKEQADANNNNQTKGSNNSNTSTNSATTTATIVTPNTASTTPIPVNPTHATVVEYKSHPTGYQSLHSGKKALLPQARENDNGTVDTPTTSNPLI